MLSAIDSIKIRLRHALCIAFVKLAYAMRRCIVDSLESLRSRYFHFNVQPEISATTVPFVRSFEERIKSMASLIERC